MKLRKEFTFDAAHNLIRYKGACERLHGHTYRLAVEIEGTVNDDDMIIDFCEVSSVVRERVLSKLDHAYLNDLLEQPTAENIALWVWKLIGVSQRAWGGWPCGTISERSRPGQIAPSTFSTSSHVP